MSALDQQYRISVLGDALSYHHLAALFKYGDQHNYIFRDQFGEMINDVVSGNSDLSVIAVENSIAGDVSDNFIKVVKSGLNIIGEIILKIQLHLGALPGVRFEDIETVYSHRMGWKETSRFFAKYPKIRFVESPSTSSGAKIVSERGIKSAGAITSRTALNYYGLTSIRDDISDHPENFTRFFILSPEIFKSETTNKTRKASLVLQLPDNEGGRVVDSLTDQFRILVSRQISNGELYIEAEIKDSSQFDHLQETIHDKLWMARLIGLYEEAKIAEGL